ncbi:BolA/IbaG family iron-sulfur metabolism protein [Pelagibacterales bacterium SAG-MED38]|nr:BolA/IbaG family iron-sulfur metabolism protein [Pelagibacterales bacterium SAG-MED38]
MNINELIINVKKKLKKNIIIENILIEDKTFLHKNHPGHSNNKFHLKIIINSNELKNFSKIDSNKKIYKILDKELKNYIHSLQILIN